MFCVLGNAERNEGIFYRDFIVFVDPAVVELFRLFGREAEKGIACNICEQRAPRRDAFEVRHGQIFIRKILFGFGRSVYGFRPIFEIGDRIGKFVGVPRKRRFVFAELRAFRFYRKIEKAVSRLRHESHARICAVFMQFVESASRFFYLFDRQRIIVFNRSRVFPRKDDGRQIEAHRQQIIRLSDFSRFEKRRVENRGGETASVKYRIDSSKIAACFIGAKPRRDDDIGRIFFRFGGDRFRRIFFIDEDDFFFVVRIVEEFPVFGKFGDIRPYRDKRFAFKRTACKKEGK